mmetsp:Transcript_78202/g.123129  ORF Transcript_78202/g.123129 Transcript_78202/m.123129 type:complete len:149 (+) Transcript_78202:139-585(+)
MSWLKLRRAFPTGVIRSIHLLDCVFKRRHYGLESYVEKGGGKNFGKISISLDWKGVGFMKRRVAQDQTWDTCWLPLPTTGCLEIFDEAANHRGICKSKESTTAFSMMTMLNLRWCRSKPIQVMSKTNQVFLLRFGSTGLCTTMWYRLV